MQTVMVHVRVSAAHPRCSSMMVGWREVQGIIPLLLPAEGAREEKNVWLEENSCNTFGIE